MSIVVPLYGFGGGAGGALNFTVKAYATEAVLLSDAPKENTIGVITETEVTSWIFSASEPSDPADGMVWIVIGTSSAAEFNAAKKNTLMVYPLSAKQYAGDAWAAVTAKSYHNGAWIDWLIFLYNRGEIGIGGTPEQIYKEYESDAVTLNYDHIAINLSGTVTNRAGFPEPVDFSRFNTVTATVKVPEKWTHAVQFRFGVDSEQLLSAAYTAQAIDGYTADTEYTITLDVSSYNGTSKPWFELYNGTGIGEVKSLYVLEIILE